MKKLLILIFLSIFSISLFSQVGTSNFVKMGNFVRILIPFLGLEGNLPVNISAMKKDMAFKVETTVLSNNGLKMFSNVSQNTYLTRGFLADVVYELLKNYRALNLKPATTQKEKIEALSEVHIMKNGDVGDLITLKELMDVLNLPVFMRGVKYFYSFPPYLGTSPKDPLHDPYIFYRVIHYPEQGVSKILPD